MCVTHNKTKLKEDWHCNIKYLMRIWHYFKIYSLTNVQIKFFKQMRISFSFYFFF